MDELLRQRLGLFAQPAAFFTGQFPARHRMHGHYATREQNEARGMSSCLSYG